MASTAKLQGLNSYYVRIGCGLLLFWLCLDQVGCELRLHTPGGTIVVDIDNNDSSPEPNTLHEVERFRGHETEPDHFKLLLAETNSMLVGARNMVYNISMDTLTEHRRILWTASENDMERCLNKQKSKEECQNYIKVIVKEGDRNLLICGTNAFKPWCRKYRNQLDNTYFHMGDESGTAKAPYDPRFNSSAIYSEGRLYSATVADLAGRDALIYSSPMRSEQHDSQWLNDPNFVSTFDYMDKIYFFFREAAVEFINCGKAIFSRVARVCKNDQGGQHVLRNTWTSFFKARLNCSIPGEYPFYFDEIQSTSELGQGNYMPSLIFDNRTDMVYAVFNTPRNSIAGSAVCGYRFSDVIKAFEGNFKEQKSAHANWLPVKEVYEPHPAKTCFNDSKQMSVRMLNFVKSHPLMDESVPAFGGRPILVQTSFTFRMTEIAVDWQVYAADQRYYDVLFIGTDDGRVIKAINKGRAQIETVIIEDLQVFDDKSPITNLKVYRNAQSAQEKLIVVSRDEIKSIPLHRCHLKRTCGDCVALQDPYCAWVDSRCANYKTGIQSIETGTHFSCPYDPSTKTPTEVTSPLPTCPPCPACQPDEEAAPTTEERRQTISPGVSRDRTTETRNDIPQFIEKQKKPGPCYGASTGEQGTVYSASTFAVALIVTILISLAVGFFAGYYLQRFRGNRHDAPNFPNPQKSPYEKSDNRYEIDPHPPSHNHTSYNANIYQAPDTNFMARPHSSFNEKQLNVVCNPLKANSPKLPNGSVESQLQMATPKGKTYL